MMRLSRITVSAALLVSTAAAIPTTAAHAFTPTVKPQSRTIAAGNANTAFIGADGKVYGIGNNMYGQLGGPVNQTVTSVRVIAPLPTHVRATSVVGEIADTVVLGSDGKVYGIGANTDGELTGSGARSSFTKLTGLPGGVHATAIAGTGGFTLVLGSDHKVYGTGDNFESELTGTGSDLHTLTPLSGLPHGVTAKLIAAGQDQSVVLGSDGNVYGAGYTLDGQLGSTAAKLFTLTPFGGMPAGLRVVDIAAGASNTVLLGADGDVYVTGDNAYGELGQGSVDSDPHPTPTRVADLRNIVALAAYYRTLLFVDRDGVVFGQGDNSFDQLTTGHDPVSLPTTLALAPGFSPARRIVEIAIARPTALVRTDDGVILGAGNNNYHELTGNAPAVYSLTVLGGQKVLDYVRPTITGTAEVGDTLHAHIGKWSVRAAQYHFQWFRGSTAIAHATASSYRLVTADRGHKVHVQVTGTRSGFKTGTATSASTHTVR